MNRNPHIFVCLLTVLVAFLIYAEASAQNATDIGFEITSPRNGANAERLLNVEGVSNLPEGYHLWVFVRRVDFEPFWWPQNEGKVDAESGKWKVQVSVGASQDIGWEFEIAVAVFEGNAHVKLREYRRDAMVTGDWRPIEMPETDMPPQILRVVKVGNSD